MQYISSNSSEPWWEKRLIVENSTEVRNRLEKIKERLAKATPAPWYVNYLDDSHFMNVVAVTTRPDSGKHEALLGNSTTEELRNSIVATTLLQADIGEGKPFVHARLENPYDLDGEGYPNYGEWEEDAEFIAHSRDDIPWLVNTLEQLLDSLQTVVIYP
jgi:hypothetical protein